MPEEAGDVRHEIILVEMADFARRREESAAAQRVRDRPVAEWVPEIARMKRENNLEGALELTYECMDAMRRGNLIMWGKPMVNGWVVNAAVILRKMGDLDTERRLLESGLSEYPNDAILLQRMRKSRELGDRSDRLDR